MSNRKYYALPPMSKYYFLYNTLINIATPKENIKCEAKNFIGKNEHEKKIKLCPLSAKLLFHEQKVSFRFQDNVCSFYISKANIMSYFLGY